MPGKEGCTTSAGREPLQHHAGPLIHVAVAADAGERAGRRAADRAGIIGRRIERLEFVAAILGLIDAVLVGADEDDDRGSQHAVFAQLLRGARGVRGDGLGEFERVGDGTSERTRDQHALPRTGVLDDVVAGDPAQLEGETFADHAGDAADETRIGFREVDGREDAMRAQAGDARPGPTPQTSSASTPRRKAVRPSTEAGTTITPPLALSALARSFASLQSTFVGAIPSEIGMPVRFKTSARMRSPKAFASASGMSGNPRKASSTE
jgi:hypothetical protein